MLIRPIRPDDKQRLADNEPARRLLRRIAAHLERATLSDGAIRDGVREVLIELEPRAQAAHAGTG
jgi:hypothetical protein